jgi:alpha-L-fucosidase
MSDFGIIFHWGIYAVPAYDSIKSARRRKVQNGSEWYLKRLEADPDSYRPVSGYKATQEFHEENFGDLSYWDFMDDLSISKIKIDKWIKLCKSVGATYVIITAKHHDGFCLFKTKTDSEDTFNIMEIDVVEEFKKSAIKYGLRFGIYYSWLEFDEKFNNEYLNRIVIPHTNELRKYNPDIWWFDGDWLMTTVSGDKIISDVCKQFKKDNPNIEINDRLGKSKKRMKLLEDINYLGNATHKVFSDRYIPKEELNIPWEHVNTIGYSWGYKSQKQSDYKTGEELYEIYSIVKELGGKFLLNLGPDSNGDLDKLS